MHYEADPVHADRHGLSRASRLVAAVIIMVLAGGGACVPAVHASEGRQGQRLYPDNLFGVTFSTETTAVATGYHGAVRLSGNAGQDWRPADGNTDDLLRRVAAAGDKALFTVSHRGRILASDDGGRQWRVIHQVPGLNLRDIAFADAGHGFVAAHNGVILRTVDGGREWQQQGLANYTGRDLPRLNGIAVIDANHALTVGEFGVVAATNDAGETWHVITEQTYPTLLQVAVAGDRGYAVGLNGTLLALRRQPAGDWTVNPVDLGTSQHLLAVALAADGKTGLIGGNGILLTITPEAIRPAAVAPEFPLSYSWIGGVAIAGNGRAIAVGQGGAILTADTPAGPFEPAGSNVLETSNATDRVTQ